MIAQLCSIKWRSERRTGGLFSLFKLFVVLLDGTVWENIKNIANWIWQSTMKIEKNIFMFSFFVKFLHFSFVNRIPWIQDALALSLWIPFSIDFSEKTWNMNELCTFLIPIVFRYFANRWMILSVHYFYLIFFFFDFSSNLFVVSKFKHK